MKLNKKFALAPIAVLSAALTLFALPGHAATTYNWNFGQLLSGIFQPSATFATLSATTSDNKYFDFDLKAKDLNALFTSGAFLTGLSVADSQTGYAADPTPTSVGLDAGTWGVSAVGLKANATGPGGTNVWDFDFIEGTYCNNSASCRLTANEEVKWHASFSVPISFNNPAFAIHVQGLTTAEGGSAWYTSTVSAIPEPETYAMLLAGLGMMGFVARRRQRKLVVA